MRSSFVAAAIGLVVVALAVAVVFGVDVLFNGVMFFVWMGFAGLGLNLFVVSLSKLVLPMIRLIFGEGFTEVVACVLTLLFLAMLYLLMLSYLYFSRILIDEFDTFVIARLDQNENAESQ